MGTNASAEGAFLVKASVETTTSIKLVWESDSAEAVYQVYKSIGDDNVFTMWGTADPQVGTIICYDTSVVMGEKYTYRVEKLVNNVVVESSELVSITMTMPSPKTLKTKVQKGNKVKVTWDKVDGASGYEIYRSEKNDKKFEKIADVKKCTYIDTKIKSGTAYYYKIYTVKKNKPSWNSVDGEIVAAYVKPSTTSVVANYTKNKMKLTWNKVSGATKYIVYKKTDGSFEQIGETKKLTYTDKEVVKEETYVYCVIAAYEKDGKIIKGSPSEDCNAYAADFDPNKKMIALTFDDGPGRYTSDIVKCLKNNNAKATFFVLGCNIGSYPKALKEAYDAGNEIGSHTYDHKMLASLSAGSVKQEMSDTDKKIKKVIGENAVVMRPPGGSYNDVTKANVGKPIIMWSVDTLDWKTRSTPKTVDCVLNHAGDGDIVLMHDIHEPTKNAALQIIPALRRKGYQLVTVSEMAKYRGYNLQSGQVYFKLKKKK